MFREESAASSRREYTGEVATRQSRDGSVYRSRILDQVEVTRLFANTAPCKVIRRCSLWEVRQFRWLLAFVKQLSGHSRARSEDLRWGGTRGPKVEYFFLASMLYIYGSIEKPFPSLLGGWTGEVVQGAKSSFCEVTSIMETPTLDQFRECLEVLASKPPSTKSGVLRSLLPDIEMALASGQTLKQIWHSVAEAGFDISYNTFCVSLRRLRKKSRLSTGPEERANNREGRLLRCGRRSGTNSSRKRLSDIASRVALGL